MQSSSMWQRNITTLSAHALQNAASIAGVILLTEKLIAERPS
jgi:chaperonin GroEL (HSP60 family)